MMPTIILTSRVKILYDEIDQLGYDDDEDGDDDDEDDHDASHNPHLKILDDEVHHLPASHLELFAVHF